MLGHRRDDFAASTVRITKAERETAVRAVKAFGLRWRVLQMMDQRC